MKQSASFAGVVLLAASLGYAASPERTAQFVSTPVTPLASVRLDSLPVTPAPVLKAGAVPRIVPRRDTWFHNQQRTDARPDNSAEQQPRRAPQTTVSAIVMLTNVAGIGYTSVMPPDTIGDVGPNHYVQMVNSYVGSQYLVFNKQG
ncbi:MAG: hypothetical protein NTV22_08785, partial [bacterium]|nr:hypothetical protein [bacterium]